VPLYLTEASQANLGLFPDRAPTLRRRHALLRTLDALPHALDRSERLAAFTAFQRRAVELLAGRRTREAFDLSREDARGRARSGETDWGRSLLTARRLVEAGVRFVQRRLRAGAAPFCPAPAASRTKARPHGWQPP
jgi:hypothetical protein